MDILSYLEYGITHILDPYTLFIIAAATLFGIIFGAIPGLTASLAIILPLPFTYGMGPCDGLSTLVAIYVGATSGGLISAILLNIPGTGASIVTTFDGYPMAKQGKPGEALALGVFASLIGGIMSTVLLVTIAPYLAKLALLFGPWEYFALGVFGVSIVVSVSSDDVLKGFIMACLGVIITLFGQESLYGIPRFTFESDQMLPGFTMMPTLIGFFAIGQLLRDVNTLNTPANMVSFNEKYQFLPSRDLIKKSWRNMFRSGIIGTVIGILPGAGGSIASFLAYDRAKKASKTPEKFGKGHYEGIIASETANNGVVGGAMIPMMTLGIPGDMVTAIILGGLLIHGLRPGPMLFRENADVVGTVFVAMFVANIFMFLIQNGLMKVFSRILLIPKHLLLPIILIMCMVGTFSTSNRIFDLWILLFFGVSGYILMENKYNMAPLILGYILGPLIEMNWRQSLIASRGDLLPFFTRPVSLSLLVVAFLSIIMPYLLAFIRQRRKESLTN